METDTHKEARQIRQLQPSYAPPGLLGTSEVFRWDCTAKSIRIISWLSKKRLPTANWNRCRTWFTKSGRSRSSLARSQIFYVDRINLLRYRLLNQTGQHAHQHLHKWNGHPLSQGMEIFQGPCQLSRRYARTCFRLFVLLEKMSFYIDEGVRSIYGDVDERVDSLVQQSVPKEVYAINVENLRSGQAASRSSRLRKSSPTAIPVCGW